VRNRRLLILTILIAGATGFALYQYLSGLDRRVSVVVAAVPLKELTVLEPSMLRVLSIPAGGVHPRATSAPETLVGKVVLVPMEVGQQILVTQVRERGSLGGVSRYAAALDPGERAMMIPTTLARGVGGGLTAGDRVDVIFVADELKLGCSFSRVLLQAVRVLDVRGDRGQPISSERDGMPAGVVVAVSLDDAERLAFALENGQLYLVSSGGRREPEFKTPGACFETLFRDDWWVPEGVNSH